MDFQNLINHFKLYVDFPEDELAKFTEAIRINHYPKGSTIVAIGEVEKNLRFIDSGICRSYIDKNGDDFTIDICFHGNFFGSYGSFVNRTTSAIGISAITDVRAFEVLHEDLEQLYNLSKQGERMGRLSAEQAFALSEQKLIKLMSKSALERYKELLENEPQLMLKVPQKFVAEYLGMAPESLSRLKHAIVNS